MKKDKKAGVFVIKDDEKLFKEEKKIVNFFKKRLKKEKYNLVFFEEINLNSLSLKDEIFSKCIDVDVMFIFGDTSVNKRDTNIEQIEPLLTQRINSFEYIYSSIALDLIDSEALFLRTLAGKIDDTFIFCFPSNYKVFKFFVKAMLFPELDKLEKS